MFNDTIEKIIDTGFWLMAPTAMMTANSERKAVRILGLLGIVITLPLTFPIVFVGNVVALIGLTLLEIME